MRLPKFQSHLTLCSLFIYSLSIFFISCSKLDIETNCLNEKATCFKADKTPPTVQGFSTNPAPDAAGYVSSLAYIDVTFSEEPKDGANKNNYSLSGGGILNPAVTSVVRLSDYTYRVFVSGTVQTGNIDLDYSLISDYGGNSANTAFLVRIQGSAQIPLTATVSHYGVSTSGFTSVDLSFTHHYTADLTNNNSYEIRLTSGAAECKPADTLLGSGTNLAPETPVNLNVPVATFPSYQNRIVVCINNQVNPTAKAVWSAQIIRDNGPITTSFSPATDSYRDPVDLTITCTGYDARIAYTSVSQQSSAPPNPATPDFDANGNLAVGTLYSAPLAAANPINPTYTKFSWRCIDIAGNKSALDSTAGAATQNQNVQYYIDNTIPAVNVTLAAGFRSYVSNSVNTSTTLNFTTDQAAGETYIIKKGGTSCTLGGTTMFSGTVTGPGLQISQTINVGANATTDFNVVGLYNLRICVHRTSNNTWGVAPLQVTRDDTIPVVTISAASGTYGAIQNIELTCSDNKDKIAYAFATQLGTGVPVVTDTPTFNAATGAITGGQLFSGPYATPDQSTTVIKYACIDKAGNQSAVQTVQYTIDATIPAVNFVSQSHAAVSNGAGAYNSVDIVWNSNRVGLNYSLRVGATTCSNGAVVATGTTPAIGTNVVTNLTTAAFPTNGTTYPVKICVVNYAGAFGYPTSTPNVMRDETSPTILPANLAPTIASAGGNNFTLSWTAADDTGGSGVATYRIFRDGTAIPTFPGYPNTPDYTVAAVAGLNTATVAMPDALKYNLRIVPVDAAGNPTALASSYNAIATRLNLSVSVTGYAAGAGDFRIQQGADTLAFNTAPGGVQIFATGFSPGAAYAVTVTAQPTNQVCAFVPKQFGTLANDLTLNVTCNVGQWVGGRFQAMAPAPLNYHLYRAKVTTIAGSGVGGFADNGTGTAAQFLNPEFLVYLNNALYVSDSNNGRVRKIALTAPYAVTTLAGSGAVPVGDATDDGACTTAKLGTLTSITTDGVNLYVSEYNPLRRIRKISDIAGTCNVVSFAGTGAIGYVNGAAATAQFSDIYNIASDGTNLYVSENGNNRIRKIELATGIVSTLAGNGATASVDAATGTSASFYSPTGLAIVGSDLYVGDVCWSSCSGANGNTIRKVSLVAPYAVSTVAGAGGTGGFIDGPATTAKFNLPIALATDGTNIFVSDLNNSVIRRVEPQNNYRVSTLAGTGSLGHADGIGPAAIINRSHGITTDGRTLYFGEWGGNRIKRLDDTGLVGYWAIAPGVNPNDYSSDNAATLNGTLVGGFLGTITDRFGTTNGASLFNGSSQQITAAATGLPSGNASRTMCAWAKPNSTPTSAQVIATYGLAINNQSFGLYISASAGVQYIGMTAYGGAPLDLLAPQIISTSQWMHLCATHDTVTSRLYFNGKLIAEGARTLATTTGGMRIGAQQGSTQYFNGGIADVRIYDKALNEGQINELAQNAASSAVGESFSTGGTGLLVHYKLTNSGAPQGPLGGSLSVGGNAPSPITGNSGSANDAFYYDGGGYHFTNSTTGLPLSNAPRTHCGWVRPANKIATGQYFTILQYGLNGTNQKAGLWLRDNAGVKKLVNGGGGNDHEATYDFPINTWLHVCNTYDGTNSSLYANGRLLDTASFPVWNTQPGPLGIGRDLPTAGFMTGGLADLRIYNNALSATQIRQLATQVPAGLVLRLDMNGDFNDTSGFGATTISNPGSLTQGRRGIANTAYQFVAGQIAKLAHSDALMQQQDISWSFWLKSPDMNSVSGEILQKLTAGSSGWVVKYDQANFAHAWTQGATGQGAYRNSYKLPSNNVWNHFAFSRSGSNMAIYINGTIYSGAGSGDGSAIAANSLNVNIGLNGGSGIVNLQDLRIYNRSLSTAEIQALAGYHVAQSSPGNLHFHAQADTYSNLTDGSAISTNWIDSTIQTAYNAAGGTSNGFPKYVTAGNSLLAGMPAVEFDGTAGKYFDFGTASLTYNGLTVCVAATRKGLSYRGLVEKRGGGTTNSWGMITDIGANALKCEVGDPPITNVIDTVADDTPTIYCMLNGSGSAIQTYINGQTASTSLGSTLTGSNAQSLIVGARFNLAGNYYGQIGDIFVLTRDLSATERRIAECYLSAKYSIPLMGGAVCP